jgi:hypothetical protein
METANEIIMCPKRERIICNVGEGSTDIAMSAIVSITQSQNDLIIKYDPEWGEAGHNYKKIKVCNYTLSHFYQHYMTSWFQNNYRYIEDLKRDRKNRKSSRPRLNLNPPLPAPVLPIGYWDRFAAGENVAGANPLVPAAQVAIDMDLI